MSATEYFTPPGASLRSLSAASTSSTTNNVSTALPSNALAGSPSNKMDLNDAPEGVQILHSGITKDSPDGVVGCNCLIRQTDHYCGYPEACCTASPRRAWNTAKNLNHLPICHDYCWRKDVARVTKRLEMQGKKHDQSADRQNPRGFLRLCHRRCYFQDLMRQLTDVGYDYPNPEYVPPNQTLLERLAWPRLQHWLMKWWRRTKGKPWKNPTPNVC